MEIIKAHKEADKLERLLNTMYMQLQRDIKTETIAFIGEFERQEYMQYAQVIGPTKITNLEYFLRKIEELVLQLVSNEKDLVGKHLEESYLEVSNNNTLLLAAMTNKWSGQDYIENLEDKTKKLITKLRRELTNALFRQVDKKQFIDLIGKIVTTSKNGTLNILRTETTYITNQALVDVFKINGYTKYRYNAVLDKKTSVMCREMDGQVFDLDEAIIGVNVPPLHPHCRSTIDFIK